MTTDAESSLIPSKIYDQMIEYQKEKLVTVPELIAKRFGPEDIPGSALDIELRDQDTFAFEETEEGAVVPFKKETTTETTLTPVDYAANFRITQKMIEDSAFGLFELNLQEASYQAAKLIDNKVLGQVQSGFDANTTDHEVQGGATITVSNITAAMEFIEADNYTPTDIIVGSEVANDLRNIDSFSEANKSGGNSPQNSLIGTIYNMNVLQSNNMPTYTFPSAGSTTGAKQALMVDRDHALSLGEKRPFTVTEYDEPQAMSRGFVASMRFAPLYLRAEACAGISTT